MPRRKPCPACPAKRFQAVHPSPVRCVSSLLRGGRLSMPPLWGSREPLRWRHGKDKLQTGGNGTRGRHSLAWKRFGARWGCIGLCQAHSQPPCDRASHIGGMHSKVGPLGASSARRRHPCCPHAWRFRTAVWARRRALGFPRPCSALVVPCPFLARSSPLSTVSSLSSRTAAGDAAAAAAAAACCHPSPRARGQARRMVKQAVALAACLGADSEWLRRCADSADSQTPGRLLCRVGLSVQTGQTGQTGQLPPRSRNRSNLVEFTCAGVADRAARNSATRRNEKALSVQNMWVPSRWLSRR
jgi:hypothetical protein